MKLRNPFLSCGREYRELGRLGFPVLVTQVGIIVVSFADTMMVGAYGLDELAAAAFVNSCFMIPILMLMGFASGMTPLIGALYGRGEHREAGRVMKAGLQMNVLMAVCFTAVMGAVYPFLDCFGQDPELLPLIREYYLIIICTLVPMSVFNTLQQTANGTTDTATPMWIIICCDFINIGGNWLLIYGNCGFPELGLAGAGVSTLVSRTVAMLALVLVVRLRRRYRKYYMGASERNVGGTLRRRVWLTSYPVMVQNGVECGLWTLGAIVSGWFGKVQLASYQVVNTIAQLGFMVYLSIGVASSIRVANFTGGRDSAGIRRVARAALHMNLLLCTVSSLVFIFFTADLVRLFTQEESVRAAAMLLVAPLVLYQYGDAVQITYANSLRGTSVVKPLFWISIVSYIMVGVPLMLFLSRGLGMESVGVYYSFNGALATASVLLVMAFGKAVAGKELEFRTASVESFGSRKVPHVD